MCQEDKDMADHRRRETIILGPQAVPNREPSGASPARSSARALAGAIVIGLVDVDAITVSMVRLTPDTLGTTDAALAILAAIASDTISKVAIGAAIGRGWFAVGLAAMALGCLAIGTAAASLSFAFSACTAHQQVGKFR
jgi:hypothetical protein